MCARRAESIAISLSQNLWWLQGMSLRAYSISNERVSNPTLVPCHCIHRQMALQSLAIAVSLHLVISTLQARIHARPETIRANRRQPRAHLPFTSRQLRSITPTSLARPRLEFVLVCDCITEPLPRIVF